MSEKKLPNFVQNLLDQIIRENDFVKYSVQVKSGSNAGDGFTSELLSIAITENECDKRLDLVCKIAPSSKHHRKEFFVDILFNREILFYSKFMPTLKKFQGEKNVPKKDQFLSFPKCYATVANEDNEDSEQYAVILEDLRPQGFKLWDKGKPTPIENARLVMRELGKFHGLSIAMKDQKPQEFSQFKQLEDHLRLFFQNDSLRPMTIKHFDRAIDSLKCENHKDIMRHIRDNTAKYLEDCLNDKVSEQFGVVCHGDVWSNNLLYQFDEHGVAVDIRFLDWQIIRYVSPAIDLLYNIFTSTDKALRDNEYDNLITLYYESLSKTVQLLGSNAAELFTFKNLKDELKRCGNYALLLAPSLISMSLADSDNIPKLDEMFDNAADGKCSIDITTGLNEGGQREYDRRINGVLEDIVTLGYYRRVN